MGLVLASIVEGGEHVWAVGISEKGITNGLRPYQ